MLIALDFDISLLKELASVDADVYKHLAPTEPSGRLAFTPSLRRD